MFLYKYIPFLIRRDIRRLQRFVRDIKAGTWFRMTLQRPKHWPDWPAQLSITQPVMPTAFFENKVHNLTLGASHIARVMVAPGQIVSFWHLIGAPNYNNGFKDGRNLVNGQLKAEPGGGLCQLASILYHTALCAGLRVTERHHHSVDIYREEDRFTPLGSDATVVYGYKDLRFENTLHQPVFFRFDMTDQQLTCRVHAREPVAVQAIEFRRQDEPTHRIVQTIACATNQVLTSSAYRL